MITEVCDSSGNLVDRGDEEPGSGAFDSSFEVLGQASIAAQPGDGSFDHPPARQQLEAFCCVGALDDFQRPGTDFGERGSEFVAGIAAIGEHVPQPWEAVSDAGEHIRCAVAILDISGVNDGANQQALRVGDDMAFAPLDLLARVEAPWAAAFRRFHALAVDHARAGGGFSTHCLTGHQQQRVIDRFPHAHRTPAVEVMLHRGHRREQTGGQHPPRQPAPQQVQDRFDDLPVIPDRRPATLGTGREHRLQDRPFRIRQIAWQEQFRSGIPLPGDIGPHVSFRRRVATTSESHLTDIAHLLFRSASEATYCRKTFRHGYYSGCAF